jgi:hypothetical protein
MNSTRLTPTQILQKFEIFQPLPEPSTRTARTLQSPAFRASPSLGTAMAFHRPLPSGSVRIALVSGNLGLAGSPGSHLHPASPWNYQLKGHRRSKAAGLFRGSRVTSLGDFRTVNRCGSPVGTRLGDRAATKRAGHTPLIGQACDTRARRPAQGEIYVDRR